MERLSIEGSDDTPKVLFDKNDNVFEISGRSLPEDSVTFYTPAFEWLKAYSKTPNADTPFTFRLDYFNTASSKIILDLMHVLKSIPGVYIVWYYRDDDEEILEAGEEFSEQVDIRFDFKPYE